jgi:glycosyltransferase 2 family protein
MLDTKRRSWRSAFLHVSGTILAIGLLAILFRQQGWEEIVQAIRQIPPMRLAAAIALTLISRIAVAGRWHVLLVAARVEIPFWQTVQITFAGLFASHFLPTTVGGDVVRLGGVLRLGYARAVSVASLVVDRLIGMLGMAMAAMSLLFQLSSLHPLRLPISLRELWQNGLSYFFVGSFLSLLSVHERRSSWFNHAWSKFFFYIRRLGMALFEWNKKPKALLASLACTWVHMLCLFGSIWLLMPPLGETISFWLVAGLWSLTYFITLLPISVNGLGVQELSVTFIYSQLGGLYLANALTIALLVRVIQMLASLPGALVIPGLLAGQKERT